MSLALYRIDDRLIHGQVVVGWGQPLHVSFIVLVDDEVSSSDWEQDLYRMGVPPEIDVIFVETEDPYGPFGAKTLGEPPIVPSVAAIGNAIFNATARRIKSLPITRDKILEVLA